MAKKDKDKNEEKHAILTYTDDGGVRSNRAFEDVKRLNAKRKKQRMEDKALGIKDNEREYIKTILEEELRITNK